MVEVFEWIWTFRRALTFIGEIDIHLGDRQPLRTSWLQLVPYMQNNMTHRFTVENMETVF